MIKEIKFILDNYLNLPLKVNSNSDVYKNIVKKIPHYLSQQINRKDIIIKGSVGQGNRTTHPWISILNKNITHSTQYGLYVVYLFKSDMSGFYLSLNQGITNFKNLFNENMYLNARKTVKYFQGELDEVKGFTKDPIDLISKKRSLGYGYEQTNIISKYYSGDDINDKVMIDDLNNMMKIYDFIYDHINDTNYDQVIQSALSEEYNYFIAGEEAITKIDQMLLKESTYPRDKEKTLQEVIIKGAKRSRFLKVTSPVQTKIDYLEKASKDMITGLEGEKLVLISEKERLTNLGYETYAEKVKWVSQYNDVAGYDILSYSINNKNQIEEVYIEVKTSVSKIDTDFYVSRNELAVSKEKGSRYWLYRVYDILSINPKYYIAKGLLSDNFILDPISYIARYKWSVE